MLVYGSPCASCGERGEPFPVPVGRAAQQIVGIIAPAVHSQQSWHVVFLSPVVQPFPPRLSSSSSPLLLLLSSPLSLVLSSPLSLVHTLYAFNTLWDALEGHVTIADHSTAS